MVNKNNNKVILISIEKEELSELVEQAVKLVVESDTRVDDNLETIPKLISRDEILVLFGITAPTLREWTKKGILPKPIRKGRRVYFLKDEIYKVLNDRKNAS